ncbi:MAG: uncharacterized protein KVP18_000092 [Porospora cf. gigantea A]|uniref:uncharacterized protein n=1 Tax=Porospora cf. gigantea A TaxID=2853593 RepID=UPI0035598720|nr:MAG: hypothetical protein KVP18_000092 [Porospora cf. gigantea A]
MSHPLYQQAARVVGLVVDKRVGVKQALFGLKDANRLPAVSALVHGTLDHLKDLQDAIQAALKVPCRTPYMLEVLVFEMVWGAGKIAGGGALVRGVKEKTAQLTKLLGVTAPKEKAPVSPRYVRVNSMSQLPCSAMANLPSGSYVCALLPDVVVCPSGTWIVDSPLVADGGVALQDASSCFPPLAVNCLHGQKVLEVCSAPGSKTLHLLDRLGDSGVLVTCEKDAKRAGVLIKRIRQQRGVVGPVRAEVAGRPVSNWAKALGQGRVSLWFHRFHQEGLGGVTIRVEIGDFLALGRADLEEFAEEGPDLLVVDPSCSGSGLPTFKTVDVSLKRVQSLVTFQQTILQHCLDHFEAKTVCYSTCSLFYEENEGVVQQVLSQRPEWKLKRPLPWWGSASAQSAFPDAVIDQTAVNQCVRTSPDESKCRGFFLACFQRV